LSRTKPTSSEPGSSSVRHSRSERALRVRRRITLLPSRKSGRNNRRGGHSCPPPKNSAGGRQPSRLHFGAASPQSITRRSSESHSCRCLS
jgi:hypothetical protein